MALSKYTKRFQITLNESKDKDKVILDYLSDSYNPKDKIKELLYIAIVGNGDTKLLTITESDKPKTVKKDTKSETKLLTVSDDKQKEVRQNELDQLKEFM